MWLGNFNPRPRRLVRKLTIQLTEGNVNIVFFETGAVIFFVLFFFLSFFFSHFLLLVLFKPFSYFFFFNFYNLFILIGFFLLYLF